MKKLVSLLPLFLLWSAAFYFINKLIFLLFDKNLLTQFLGNYDFVLPIVLGAIATLVCVRKNVFPETQVTIAQTLMRYFLGIGMLPYALSKILQTQFVVLPFSSWQTKLEDLHGTTLTWAFLGYSPNMQILLGVLEFVPGVLLLIRRSAFIGSLLMLPMTLNVFLINHALNLWSQTKIISFEFLCINILLLALEWKKIRAISGMMIGKVSTLKYFKWEALLVIVITSLLMYPMLKELIDYRNYENKLTGDWFHRHPNEWVLQSERLNDSLELDKHVKKVYYGVYGEYEEVNDTGRVEDGFNYYAFDENAQQINLYSPKGDSVQYSYKFLNDSILQMTRKVDTLDNQLVSTFQRRVINQHRN